MLKAVRIVRKNKKNHQDSMTPTAKQECTNKITNKTNNILGKNNVYIIGITIMIGLMISYLYDMGFLAGQRFSFGVLLIVFIPGYLLTNLLFDCLDWVETVALSFCLSIGSVGLLFIITNIILKIPLNSMTNIIVLFVFCITLLIFNLFYQKK
jgi:uncharacterized membrane protein